MFRPETLGFALLPPSCLLCGRRGSGQLDLCEECRRELPWQQASCATCAIPLPGIAGGLQCGQCMRKTPVQDSAFSPLRYDYPLAQLIQAFKFRGAQAAGRVLGDLFAASLPFSHGFPNALLPVPLHPTREQERGFNQASLLARALGRHHGIPVIENAIQRVRATTEQSGMSGAARQRNIRNAFARRAHALPAHIAIVDDVMTTGSTLREIASLLRKEGVERIQFWTLARTR